MRPVLQALALARGRVLAKARAMVESLTILMVGFLSSGWAVCLVMVFVCLCVWMEGMYGV